MRLRTASCQERKGDETPEATETDSGRGSCPSKHRLFPRSSKACIFHEKHRVTLQRSADSGGRAAQRPAGSSAKLSKKWGLDKSPITRRNSIMLLIKFTLAGQLNCLGICSLIPSSNGVTLSISIMTGLKLLRGECHVSGFRAK